MYKKTEKYSISCKMCPQKIQICAKKVIMKLVASFHYCWKRLKVPTSEMLLLFWVKRIFSSSQVPTWSAQRCYDEMTIEVEHVSCFPSSPKLTTPFLVLFSLMRLPHSLTTPKPSLHCPLASSLVQEKRLAPFSSSPKRATPPAVELPFLTSLHFTSTFNTKGPVNFVSVSRVERYTAQDITTKIVNKGGLYSFEVIFLDLVNATWFWTKLLKRKMDKNTMALAKCGVKISSLCHRYWSVLRGELI